jgi:integrase
MTPLALAGPVCVSDMQIPRFWATIWSEVCAADVKPSTRRVHLANLDRLYASVHRQCGADVLDRLLAAADFDAIEECLAGFLGQLRNEAAIDAVGRAKVWKNSVRFVLDVLRLIGPAGRRASDMHARLHRLEMLYAQLTPNPKRPPPPIRALPATVLEDLYELFDPHSPRNPFKTEAQRWRNLLVFMLLLRLGLRRGELALLLTNSIKEEFDPVKAETVTWIDVQQTQDDDPRYVQPGLKTPSSRRQIPIQRELADLARTYIRNYRGAAGFPQMLISQKALPLSLRSISEIFEIATKHLSSEAHNALSDQGIASVSCHDLRHTCAVVRMRRYQDAGHDVDRAQEKLRLYFGWTPESQMPRLYARAFFETRFEEVWNEGFDTFVDALRRTSPENLHAD